MSMSEQLYRQLLAGHDWFYDYSDDHSVWSHGNAMRGQIRNLQKQIDPDHKIWNEYAPADFKVVKQ